MIRKQSNILILDTEASCLAGNFASPLVYDFAYIIKDKDFNEIIRRNFIVKETWETKGIMEQAYYACKIPFYNQLIENKEVEVLPLRDIINIFIKDIKKYKVKTICAYNLAFDDRALTATIRLCASQLLDKFKTELEKRNSLCLWNLACDSLMQSEDYKKFCTDNGFVTECGNFKTSAEIAKRFICKDTEYIEDHTALRDCEDEFEIFEYICNNCNGNMTYGLFYNCWRKVK